LSFQVQLLTERKKERGRAVEMVKGRVVKIFLTDRGEYLGFRGNEFFVNDKNRKEKGSWDIEHKEISEIILKAGNLVSTNALEIALEWKISVLLTKWNGEPLGVIKALDDDSHVKTRLCQYESVNNDLGLEIAKKIVYAKLRGQNQVLKKYGFKQYDLMKIKESINKAEDRQRLLTLEGHMGRRYFRDVFQLFPEFLRVQHRRTKGTFDALNNLFNFGYSILFWRCYSAVLKAKLEAYLGFLHSVQVGKPSLVCDVQELYRYIVDDCIIGFAETLRKNSFRRVYFGKPKYPRLFLKSEKHREFEKRLHECFDVKVEIPRIRHGKRQTVETLINEEALLLARFLRGEVKEWNPRTITL
jgi:CRISPR-associated protein Cas1